MKKLLIILLALTLTACPRGEHKNLESLLSIAKTRYKTATATHTTPQLKMLNQIDQQLQQQENLRKSAAKTAFLLEELLPSAGYTTRPALTELIKQYYLLSKNKKAKPATFELIASRTYNLMASELESTAFRIKS